MFDIDALVLSPRATDELMRPNRTVAVDILYYIEYLINWMWRK